jgi:hypothetical protein
MHRQQSIKELLDDLNVRFTYHPPKEGQPEKYQRLRMEAHSIAISMVELCPQSRELSLAIGKLEEAVFWANAGIARHGS